MKRISKIIGVITVMFYLTSSSSFAADFSCTNSVDISDLSVEQLEETYGNCLLSELSWVDDLGIDETWITFLGLALTELGYWKNDLSAVAKESIGAYQREKGYVETGELTIKEMSELIETIEKMNTPDVYLPSGGDGEKPAIYGSTEKGYVSFEGTWKIEGENIAYPYNFSRYECFKQSCRAVEINLKVSGSTVNMYSPNIVDYDVLEWNEYDFIIKKSAETDDGCRKNQIHVNVELKEVFQITKQMKTCKLLGEEGNLSSPRISRLVGSWDAGMELNKKSLNDSHKLMSSKVQVFLKEFYARYE